jgi:formate hydrogenlyase subunit 3/multisubunit Na+/H+ antiporter MnhD subunit
VKRGPKKAMDQVSWIVAVIAAIIVVPAAVVGVADWRRHRRQRALAGRRKQKYRL